jgi:DNA primase
MNKIPQSFIDDLLHRIDIVDLINKRVPLKKMGANYSARCPFHNEKSPSFTVSDRKQFYYCFGCGASGNAIGFLIEYDHLNFLEAVEALAQQAGVTIPNESGTQSKQDDRKPLYEIMRKTAAYFHEQLLDNPAAIPAKDYLKSRGLTGKTVKQFQVGYAPNGWDLLQKHLNNVSQQQLLATGLLVQNDQQKIYDRFRDRVMFPIRDRQGRVIGFGGRVMGNETPKYLNSPETAIFHKGSELYGLYEALDANQHLDEIIVVEGYMDVIALAQHEVTNAVATLGTATTSKNAERLFRETDTVIFCFDGDNAGKTAAWRALENILPILQDGFNARFAFLPNDEDPDSYIRQHGKETFLKEIKRAKPLSIFLLDHLSEQADLNTLDGRSRLAKLAEPLIKQIPGAILQQLLIDELAKRTHMESPDLRQLFGLPTIKKMTSTPKKQTRGKTHVTPMQQTISLLLQYPAVAKNIEPRTHLTLPGTELLEKLLNLLRETPHLNTGALLEYWRDTPILLKQLQTLASRELLIAEEHAEREFNALMTRLHQLEEEGNLTKLHEKMHQGTLTDDEKREYLARIKKSKS